MTKKRFTLAYETNDQHCIWWAIRDGYKTLWKEEVVGLLNELNDENEQLKQQIKDMKIRFKRKYDHEFDEIVDELEW